MWHRSAEKAKAAMQGIALQSERKERPRSSKALCAGKQGPEGGDTATVGLGQGGCLVL